MKSRKSGNKHGSMLSGYSLLFVIFIMSMLAMILAGLMTLQILNRKQSLEWMKRAEIECNVQSAITLMRDPSFTLPDGQPYTISLFNEMSDSVTLCRSRWGFFNLLKASARHKTISFSRIALCGDYHHNIGNAALFLGSSFKPLCLCGNTILKGIFQVPRAGIKAATVAGKFYQRKLLVDGEIDAADRVLPTINPRYLRLQIKEILQDYAPFSRVIRLKAGIINDTISNSFREPTVVLYADDGIILNRCVLNGNVVVLCDSVVRVEPTAQINDAIICAKNIFIKPRFKGTGQFIATDTLQCGQSCTFPVPSILAVISQVVNPVPFLFFGEHSFIEGTVLTWSINPIKPYSSIGIISKHSRIIGSLYTNGEITLDGEVHGNVIAKGFILQNPEAKYQNYLIDAVIDYSRQPPYFVGNALNENKSLLNVIKWLK